jgi:hypothetical protein
VASEVVQSSGVGGRQGTATTSCMLQDISCSKFVTHKLPLYQIPMLFSARRNKNIMFIESKKRRTNKVIFPRKKLVEPLVIVDYIPDITGYNYIPDITGYNYILDVPATIIFWMPQLTTVFRMSQIKVYFGCPKLQLYSGCYQL